MDCAGLRADIDKLEQELRALGEKVETVRGAEEHDKELQEVAKLIGSNSADLMLEKYLKDFQERNLDIFPVVTLGERIDIRDTYGGSATVYNIAAAGLLENMQANTKRWYKRRKSLSIGTITKT